MRNNYGVPVLPMDVLSMNERDVTDILREALYEFPVLEVSVDMPEWIGILNSNHYVKKSYVEKIKESAKINIACLDAVAEQIKAGMSTAEIDRIVYDTTIKYHGSFIQEFNMEAIVNAIKRRIYILDLFENIDGDPNELSLFSCIVLANIYWKSNSKMMCIKNMHFGVNNGNTEQVEKIKPFVSYFS